MLLALASMIFLTWESVVNHDWEAAAKQGEIKEEVNVEIDETAEGYLIFTGEQGKSCIACHGADMAGGGAAPALIGNELTAEEVAEVIKNGRGAMPSGQFAGTDEELQILAEFIASLKAEE